MKTFKQLKEEIANVSSGVGVRGFGDVTGTPKVGEEEATNPHIERVVQGAQEYSDLVSQFVKNSTEGMHTFDDDNWWAQIGAKGSALTGLGNKGNKTKGAGLEFDAVKPGKHKGVVQEEIGGIGGTVGSTSVGTGYIAGAGVPLEGKPSNWAEPGVQPKDQGRKKKKEDDPRMFGMFKRKAVSILDTSLKEIPIQEEGEGGGVTTSVGPGMGDNPTKEVFPGKTKKNKPVWPMFRRLPLKLNEEIKKGMFAGEETFVVPSHVYEKAFNEKRKGKHWRTYIKDEMFHPAIREFAYKNPKKPIIFEDEKTGYMSYARYGRKKR